MDIEIFSDVLCVWAYGAQARFDQLKSDFGDKVSIKYRFIPLFASTQLRVVDGWKDKGGLTGFNAHTHEVVAVWSHVSVHRDIWTKEIPSSSTLAHRYLKAVQILEERGEISTESSRFDSNRSPFEELIWRLRCRFFEQNGNIALRANLDEVARDLRLPIGEIHRLLENGEADAALHLDAVAQDKYLIPGSPTLVLNEGRQRLYGNVSYRIIEANVQELLTVPSPGNASWC